MPAVLALPELIWIALLLFAFAFVWTIRKLIAALFGWLISLLESIPAIGGSLAAPFHAIEQAVANALGSAEHAIDHVIGASYHLLARWTDWLWKEVRGHAVLIAEVVTGIYPLVVAYHALRSLAHLLERGWRGIDAGVKTLHREVDVLARRVRSLEHEVANGIGNDLRVGLNTVEREVHSIETGTIPAIQQAERDAQAAIDNLYEWAKGKAALLGVGTFTTAVTAVLAAVGLDWIACRGRNSVNGKSGCGLWNDLENVLGIAIVTGLALDLPALIGEAQKVTPGIIDEIEKLAGLKS